MKVLPCSLPQTIMISVMPARDNVSRGYKIIGLSYTGSKCLFVMWVSGRRRVPDPPAKMMPFMRCKKKLFFPVNFYGPKLSEQGTPGNQRIKSMRRLVINSKIARLDPRLAPGIKVKVVIFIPIIIADGIRQNKDIARLRDGFEVKARRPETIIA